MEIKEKLFAEKNRLKQGKKQKRRSKKDEIKNRIPLSKKELIKKLKRKRKENRKKKKLKKSDCDITLQNVKKNYSLSKISLNGIKKYIYIRNNIFFLLLLFFKIPDKIL